MLPTYCTMRHLQRKYKYWSKSWFRSLFSQTGKWDEAICNSDLLKRIEEHWKPILQQRNVDKLKDPDQKKKPKYYVLSMFPYPSGNLHMGHVRVYTISDIIARFQEMRGKQVIHPMGWDAFGLPAENAAIERGISPEKWTRSNISVMKSQLQDMCCSFDWDMELATCDPEYYRWTQYIFLKMYEAGLAYQKDDIVNWDPVDKTVLANEQIDEHGCSWRSGAKVEKRYLRQWFLQTTAYSKSLVDGLSEVDPDLWQDVVSIQRNWIGECTGCHIKFQLRNGEETFGDPVYVFTECPELLYGISHIVLPTSHRFNSPKYYKDKSMPDSDIQLTIEAVHPLTNQILPVVVSKTTDTEDFIEMKLGIPDISHVDKEMADRLGVKWNSVIENGKLVNSHQLDGLTRQEAFDVSRQILIDHKVGGHLTNSKLKDWLISRQRYWGTPIPIIHCPKCKAVPVPYEDLPVKLPVIDTSTDRSTSLQQYTSWIQTKCPRCGGEAKRETDTMDTFLDSSWYFLRYLDVKNQTVPFSREKVDHYMPVDLYVGGKEHAVLHLYYARFFNHFLYDEGLVSQREPFINLLTQGYVMAKSYRTKKEGRYLRPQQVDFSDSKPTEKDTGEKLIVEWEKMSKSKYNGADPQEFIKQYGVDATRMSVVAGAKPSAQRNWSNDLYTSTLRWKAAVWRLVRAYIEVKNQGSKAVDPDLLREHEDKIKVWRNLCVFKVFVAFEHLFNIGEATARLHSLVNNLKKVPADVQQHSSEFERALTDLILLMAPIVPNFAEECFMGLSSVGSHSNYVWGNSVFDQSWPEADKDHMVDIDVQANNLELFDFQVRLGSLTELTEDDIMLQCRKEELFVKYIEPIHSSSKIDLRLDKLCVKFELPSAGGSELEQEFVSLIKELRLFENRLKKQKHKDIKGRPKMSALYLMNKC
ncbi:hypothetical protein FSP39_005969 [Pinctada imbricata]|uniref:leucine--tRNA ligase n=1 Tax=Pinctada imbricata TaxID=66713 RepID=A0AA88YD53_PINIB|nr:hypothetical protein FSP39_005969 [Pinctada imbricata]